MEKADFERVLTELRPKLHRYCARMTGSVIDGEDVLQEALIKAMEAFPHSEPIAHPDAWLIRIAHNTALDFLRRRAREESVMTHDSAEGVGDEGNADRRLAAAASLRTLMRLPVAQRACVVLMDVLGYRLQEVGGILDMTAAAVKANLHRGRDHLRTLAARMEERSVPKLTPAAHALLQTYIDRFNARDFDAVRAMLADEVRVDVVGRRRLNGRSEAERYFGNYAKVDNWRFTGGSVEGRPAILVGDARDPDAPPSYFILLEWSDGSLREIRDFGHARYIVEDADISVLR
jgi:RNA polymerase sigma-70 factor (ECF subfamily)